jgi:hypothetical protein
VKTKKAKNKIPAKFRVTRKPVRVLTLALQEAFNRHPFHRQLSKLSPHAKLIIRLICEDMKGHRFFSALRNIGLDDTCHQPELGNLVLAYAGLSTDNVQGVDPFGFYFDLLDKHSKKTKITDDSIPKEAVNVYWKLMMWKLRMEKKSERTLDKVKRKD